MIPADVNSNPHTSLGNHKISRSFLAYLSTLISMMVVWLLIRQPEGWLSAGNVFRNYYPSDQLSYAGFTANARAGDFSFAEPFTGTGISYYPSWWYRLQGLLGNVVGLELGSTWNILGMLVVLATVALIGLVAWWITCLWWSPLAIGLLMGIGPLAIATGNSWAASLGTQAILWGPYGAFYTLNAEVIGLCMGASALALTFLNLSTRSRIHKSRMTFSVLSAFVIGLIANVQTYAFFLSLAIYVAFWSIYGLRQSGSRAQLVWSLVILTIVLISGNFLRATVGELATFLLMLSAGLPGLFVLAHRKYSQAFFVALALAVGAAPQVILTVSGMLSGNEFLAYRVDQSSSLGVGVDDFLILGSPVLVLFVFNALALHGTTRHHLLAGLYAWFVAFVLLTFNNAWGFGQEPYRFWINGVFLGIAIMAITTPIAIKTMSDGTRYPTLTGGSAAIAVTVFALSLWNIGGFRIEVQNAGVINLDSPQLVAVESLASTIERDDILLSAEPCLDPRLLKIATLKPVAFYNLGMAWPEKRQEIDAVLANSAAGVLDLPTLKAAGVTHLVTDTACSTGWDPVGQPGVLTTTEITYSTDSGPATMRMWELFR